MLCRVKRFCSVQFWYDSVQEPGVGHPSPTPLVVRRGSDVVLHVRTVHGGRLWEL